MCKMSSLHLLDVLIQSGSPFRPVVQFRPSEGGVNGVEHSALDCFSEGKFSENPVLAVPCELTACK